MIVRVHAVFCIYKNNQCICNTHVYALLLYSLLKRSIVTTYSISSFHGCWKRRANTLGKIEKLIFGGRQHGNTDALSDGVITAMPSRCFI